MRVPIITVVACSMLFEAVVGQETGGPPPAPQFEEAPCPFTADAKVLEQVRCGYVAVLENRSAPNGRRLKLSVAILKSLSRTPLPDPVVVLGGGPGSPLVTAAPAVAIPESVQGDVPHQMVAKALIQALRVDRDVILYDQRGVGFSEPKFCPEEAANWVSRVGEARRARVDVAARCGDSMRRAGFDLGQYNSGISALDLQDLRHALGHEQWNIFGHSYGSRLALVAMREAPKGIRSVTISGVYAPNVALWFNRPGWVFDVLQRVSAACAEQQACKAAFPDVEQTLWRAVDQLTREPWTREVPRPDGSRGTATMTAATFIGRLQSALRTPRTLSMVPMLVHAIRARDQTIVNAIMDVWRRQPSDPGDESASVSQGLQFTVQCFEEAPLNTAELHERVRRSYPAVLVDGGVFTDPSVCERLHSFRETPEQARPVESEIPTLIVTGEFDPQTHRSNGRIVQRSLKNSQLADVPGAAHSGAFDHDCTRTMVRDFLTAPYAKRDMSCLRAIPPLKFVTDVKVILR
jgi:pimeloyl-ACP methyl ester carboxylesterase